MSGFAAVGEVLNPAIPIKQQSLQLWANVRNVTSGGGVVALAWLGTSIPASFSYPIINTILPAGFTIPIYPPASNGSGNFNSATMGIQAKGGATLADTTVAGIGQSQLNAILQKAFPWGACVVEAPVNDLITSVATVNSVLSQLQVIGSKLVGAGIYPIFTTWHGTSSSSVAFKVAFNIGLYLMCDKYGWGCVDVEFATIDPVDGEENATYVVDTIHPRVNGSLRYVSAIARFLSGQPAWSHPLLAKARAHQSGITNQTWMNLFEGSGFIDAAGSAVTTGFATSVVGGSVTARTKTTPETDYTTMNVADLKRTANTGDCNIKPLTDATKTFNAGDRVIMAWRWGGDFTSSTTRAQFFIQTFNAAPNEIISTDAGGLRGGFVRDFKTGWQLLETTASATGQRMALGIGITTDGTFDGVATLTVGQMACWNISAWERAEFVVP